MDTRIIELAIEALEEKRKAIAAEIAELTAQITGGAPKAAGIVRKGRRTRTAAERRAHSERMKAIWAERKAKAGKSKAAKPARSKGGHSSAANKARSEKMRAYWAKRRAQKGK